MIHIDGADKDPRLPDVGDAKKCARKNCPGPRGWRGGFGLAGGGFGPYEYCDCCSNIVSKTCLPDVEA
jgi:hypothetical protein